MPSEPTADLPNDHVPGDDVQPSGAPVEEIGRSERIGSADRRYDQMNGAGEENIRGGGEFPDPDTPPDYDAGAPGAARVGHREHGQGQYGAALAEEAAAQDAEPE